MESPPSIVRLHHRALLSSPNIYVAEVPKGSSFPREHWAYILRACKTIRAPSTLSRALSGH